MPGSWNKIICASFLMLVGSSLFGQEKLLSDISFLSETHKEKEAQEKSKRAYIYSPEDKLAKKINPINMAFGGLLYVYQNTLSQQFSATCLYQPSCSEFSKKSIHEYGLLKGLFLSADRVSRCNRIAATGIHPLRIENNKVSDPVTFYKSFK